MNPEYERSNLMITEFDAEDANTTSEAPHVVPLRSEKENAYRNFKSFGGTWF